MNILLKQLSKQKSTTITKYIAIKQYQLSLLIKQKFLLIFLLIVNY